MMPVLFSAPTLIITDLKKAFAVFGLMSIRLAICLVLRSWSRTRLSPVRAGLAGISAQLFRDLVPLGDFFPVRERSQVLAQFRDSISSRMPEVGSAAFLKRLHSEIWKERNRYDGHCGEQVIGFCFVENCQSPCSWMELLGKRGSLRLLRSRRWAGGTHPEGEIPRQVTLRVRYLNRDHSQSSYQSYEESDPQKRCRIAQN